MRRSSPLERSISRRAALAGGASLFAGATFPGASLLGASSALAAGSPVRVTDGGPGTAGAIWRPLIDSGQFPLPQGQQVEWVSGTPGQVQMQLSTGAANLGVYGALGAAEINARAADIVIVGPALNNHGRWIVRDNSGIRSIRDLAGKTIATQSEASDTFRHARLAAQLNGFDLKKEAQLVFGPPTANIALFERGDADAVITIEPTATRLIARGAREIARTADLWHRATGDSAPLFLIGIAAHRAWAEQNRDIVAGFTGTLVEVHRKLHREPQRLSALYKEFGIPESERAAIELLPKRIVDIYSVDWGKAVFANIDRQIDEAVKAGILAKNRTSPFMTPA